MSIDQDREESRTGSGGEGSEGTTQSSNSSTQQDVDRIGTKEDIRGTNTEAGGGNSEPRDNRRDGT